MANITAGLAFYTLICISLVIAEIIALIIWPRHARTREAVTLSIVCYAILLISNSLGVIGVALVFGPRHDLTPEAQSTVELTSVVMTCISFVFLGMMVMTLSWYVIFVLPKPAPTVKSSETKAVAHPEHGEAKK